MKYLKENILNPRTTHDESFKLIKARWNDGIRPITLVKKYHWGIYENLFARPIKILQFLTAARIQKCLT